MVDVNFSTEVKVYGTHAVPAVEMEDRSKPQVKPVQQSDEAATGNLDDRALHGRSVEGEKSRLSREEARKVADEVQKRLDSMGTRLQLSLNKDPDSVVVQVFDQKSGDLIRQFPPKELLDLQKKLTDLVGLLFDGKV